MNYKLKNTLFWILAILSCSPSVTLANNRMLGLYGMAPETALPSSKLYFKILTTLDESSAIKNILIEEDKTKSASAWEEIIKIQSAKNAKKNPQVPDENDKNWLINSNAKLSPYQKEPSYNQRNYLNGTDIVFNNHLIL